RALFRAPGGGDPRVLTFPSRATAILGRPEHVTAIGAAWVKKLNQFASGDSGDALAEITVGGLSGSLRVGEVRVPLPRVAMGRLAPTLVRAKLSYETIAEAQELLSAWPKMAVHVESNRLVQMVGLGGLTKEAKLSADGSMVTLEVPVAERQMQAVARIIQLFAYRARAVIAPAPGSPSP